MVRNAPLGKALSDKPTLKPYWGKPAVRNFREGNGNVGIMRSPLRAIALPDQSSGAQYLTKLQRPRSLDVTRAACSRPFSGSWIRERAEGFSPRRSPQASISDPQRSAIDTRGYG